MSRFERPTEYDPELINQESTSKNRRLDNALGLDDAQFELDEPTDVISPTAATLNSAVDLALYVPRSDYDQLAEQYKQSNQSRVKAEFNCRKLEEKTEQLLSMHKSTQSILVHRHRASLKALKGEIEQHKLVISEDQSRVKQLTEQLATSSNTPPAQVLPQLNDNNKLRAVVADLQSQIEELKANEAGFKAELVEYQRIAEEAQQKLITSEASSSSSAVELSHLMSLQAQLDQLMLQKQQSSIDTTEDESNTDLLAVNMVAELELLRRQKVDNETLIAKLRQQLVSSSSDGVDAVALDDPTTVDHSAELAEAEKKIKSLTEELLFMSSTLSSISTTGDNNAALVNDLQTVKNQRQKLEEEVALKDDALKKQDGVVKKREEQLKQLKENAQMKLKEASEHIKKLKGEYENLRSAYQQMKVQSEDKLKKMHTQMISNRSSSLIQRKQILSTMLTEIEKLKTDNAQLRSDVSSLNMGTNDISKQLVAEINKQSRSQTEYIQVLRENYDRELRLRKKIFNQLQELKGNIRVYARVRPLSEKEKQDKTNFPAAISVPRDGELKVDHKDKKQVHNFEFERVFSPTSSQEDVFEEVQDLVISVLDGYNVCIFAYGQTGSGKTHTMEGYKDSPGVNVRALAKLFSEANSKATEWDFKLRITLLEIYNEKVQDLLNDQENNLRVVQGKDGMEVLGLTQVDVHSSEDVQNLLTRGKKNRHVTKTDMNEHSSRSHLILSVYAQGRNKHTGAVASGKLHLIDLAGSERISRSGVTGEALKEAQKINYSLSALGNVISARANKKDHVPYRDSMLTFLLQDSLEKNSKTLMFVQISPTTESVTETLCSLRFAERVRKVELGKAGKNVAASAVKEAPENDDDEM